MGQLAFLLVGSDALRRRWFVVTILGALLLLLGLVISFDALDGVTPATVDLFGLIFLLQGLIVLFTQLLGSSGPGRLLRMVRAVLLIVLSFLILDFPVDNKLTTSILFGAAFFVDGFWRAGSAIVLRYPGWRTKATWGVVEMILAALIVSDWPLPRERNIPFCIALLLFYSGWALVRSSLQLRKLEPEVAILALPIFSGRNWYDNAPVLLGEPETAPPPSPLTVHVWTPVGSADVSARRLVVDRYIAAVDRNGVISTGHAAMEGPHGVYISHYPGVEIDRGAGQFAQTLRATADNDMPGRFKPSYAEETAGWCEADTHVVFNHYSVRRLRAFWAGYRQEDTYNLTNRNCSVAVASALDAALEGVLASPYPWARILTLLINPDLWVAAMIRHHAQSMTWTPGMVLDYARALKRLVEPSGRSWGARAVDAMRHFIARRAHPAASSMSDVPGATP